MHIGVGRENLTEKHWIYYPEDTVFHRIFVQGNASPHCNPPGGFGLTCEITYSPFKPLPCDGDELVRLCIEDCRRGRSDPGRRPNLGRRAMRSAVTLTWSTITAARAPWRAFANGWPSDDILLAGRYSEWEYYNSDHAFIAGKKAAEQVRARRQMPARAQSASDYFTVQG